jgi:hypothetical protein
MDKRRKTLAHGVIQELEWLYLAVKEENTLVYSHKRAINKLPSSK